MIRKFLYIFIASFLFQGITSCMDNEFYNEPDGEETEGIPVEIEVILPDVTATRDISEESKKSFETGELIHISAVYTCKDVASGAIYKLPQYGCMQYKGHGSWQPYDGEYALSWPGTAISGTFKAYYLHGSTGILTETTMPSTLLSDYHFGEDPLFGEAIDLEYGRAVRLEMSHIFTFLTLTEMNPDISQTLAFSLPETSKLYSEFHNAFRLEIDETTKEIKPVFVSEPSTTYFDDNGNGMVFISGETILYDTEEGDVKTMASYFLEPGAYDQFSLLYPKSRDKMNTYLTYTRDLSVVLDTKGLLANNYYEFSILKSLGVLVHETPQDGWDDESDPHIIIDVEKFLKAANSGDGYSEKDPETGEDVQILESTVAGTRLLRNIDFNHFYYDVFENENFVPNLALNFDGNYHYIYNMACPLFNENHGTISNVGFVNVTTNPDQPILSTEKLERYGNTYDFSRNGIIARYNIGTISNIRVKNVDIVVDIETTGNNVDESSQEAHNAAILIGSNRGNVYDLALSGNMKITVRNHPGTEVMPTVIIGTLAGQNLGNISRVAPINSEDGDFPSPTYSIINNCQGEAGTGVYIVGGAAGSTTGNLYDVLMSSVTVDGSNSLGVESIMGGIIGTIGLSNSGAAEVSGCIFRGNVTAGTTRSFPNINANSYTGGVAGSMNIQGIVKNSSASVTVNGTNVYDEAVTYAVGGAFGRIEQTVGAIEGSIQTLACFGSGLSGLVNVGNFAGLTPPGFTWEDHYSNHEINVRQYSRYQNIGGFK